jgi:hypothetical protein
MRAAHIAILAAMTALMTACTPTPGSVDWCKGVENGSIQPTASEMMDHALTCAGHALDGVRSN